MLRLLAWEATAACNLACAHCRAEARTEPDPSELGSSEAHRLVDELAGLARPERGPIIFIITGGEPLLRPDVYEVASHASTAGLHTVVGTNGTLLDSRTVQRLLAAQVKRLSVSLDAPDAASHNAFRGVPGAFEAAAWGLAEARRQGLPFQINTTVTRRNLALLPAMLEKAVALGAVTWDVFMLVPTGRGVNEAGITAPEYERVLGWVAETSRVAPIEVKVTCGPHYARVWRQRAGLARSPAEEGSPPGGRPAGRTVRPDRPPAGCMAGDGFCFVSRVGEVYPCGYLPVSAGNVSRQPFPEIYASSPVLLALRDPDRLSGKCGRCEYKTTCHGCRARAYSRWGDYLAEEPLCLWRPRGTRPAPLAATGNGVGAR